MSSGFYWYIGVGTVLTIYQGYRGFMFQWVLNATAWPDKFRRMILLCVADTILYTVSSVAGFVALWLAYELYKAIPSVPNMSAGASILLVSLSLFGLFGVTGQLPHLIQQGKLIPGGGGEK